MAIEVPKLLQEIADTYNYSDEVIGLLCGKSQQTITIWRTNKPAKQRKYDHITVEKIIQMRSGALKPAREFEILKGRLEERISDEQFLKQVLAFWDSLSQDPGSSAQLLKRNAAAVEKIVKNVSTGAKDSGGTHKTSKVTKR